MPRCARLKSGFSIYHIMVKSISEVLLFKCDEDKDKYLSLLKKYKDTYYFKVYCYCLMNNHAHFMIDANGADISKIMQGINLSYVLYYNQKYNRSGHLFQDRFKSKIVDSESYLMKLSAYIHNNPTDIQGYRDSVEKYPYSSFGVYLGISKNVLLLVEEDFVMSKFSENKFRARTQYLAFVKSQNDCSLDLDCEFDNSGTEYRSERSIINRNLSPRDIIDFISTTLNISSDLFLLKGPQLNKSAVSLCVLLMRGLCDMKHKEICAYLGNITQSHISKLCGFALNLINTEKSYKNLISDFLHIQNSNNSSIAL